MLVPPRPYRWRYQHVAEARQKGFVRRSKKVKPDD
jgi:hypothetical protein